MEKILLVLATRNRGKIGEFRQLLKDFPVEVKSLDDFGPLPEIEEDGKTFEENAYTKAAFAARILGIPALADDSGLVVETLGGAPGVYSARYAGESATDAENNAKLLREMEGKKNRSAVFECVISIAVPSGAALTYAARCKGEIQTTPRGKNGFGYDPIFYYPPLKKTFSELSLEEKTKVSHRGQAMAELQAEFDKVIIWIKQRLSEAKPKSVHRR